MKFIDKEHEEFYKQKLNQIGSQDIYRRALTFTKQLKLDTQNTQEANNLWKTFRRN